MSAYRTILFFGVFWGIMAHTMQAQSVLLVTNQNPGSLNTSDQAIKSRLESMGLTVFITGGPGTVPSASDADGKSLVIISASVYSTSINSIFRDVDVPVICNEPWLFDDMKMTSYYENYHYGATSSRKRIRILNSTHPIAVPYNYYVDVLSYYQEIGWGYPHSTADLIASVEGGGYSIFVYEEGEMMKSLYAPAMRIGFFLGPNTAAYLNSTGWQIFENTVNYALSCTDVTDGGKIAGFESRCGGFNPAAIISQETPSGTSSVEYEWIMSTEGPINDQNFTVIPNSNFASYDPPYTTQSTWYRRRAKGAGCPEFLSVSNEIAKIVEDCSSQSPDLYTPGINYLACTVSSFQNNDFAISLENEGEYAFDDEGGTFTVYDNGTARIEGVIEYINDNSHGYGYGYGGYGHGHGYGHHCNNESKWRVTLWLKNRRNWNEWSAMGRTYRAGGNASNHTGWDYYELDTDRSVFVGMGHSSDEIVYLTPNPANYSYGFQVGDGANDKNSDFGISGTFNFASNSSDFNGSGQINTRQECEIICSPEIASTEEEITHFATNEHALWIVLPGMNQGPERNYQFDSNGGKLTRYNDKTGLITGRVENLGNPSKKYRTEIWLINARSWEEWSEMGRGYKDGGDGSNHEDWEYFEIDRNRSRLIGEGSNQGDTLFLTHMPSDFYYGVQIGWGANDKTTDYGLSGWFEFSGAETGHGDINMNIATTETHYASSVTYVCKGSGFNPNGQAVNFNNYRVSGQNLNDFVFDSKGARFSTYNNYTAKIEGDIFHPSRPGQQWHVCLWLNAKQDWFEWEGIGKTYLTGNASLAITEEMHTVWDYYSLNTEKSLLTGRGENSGDTLFLSLDSHTYNYGFQVGTAANGKNDDYGTSGWFDYSSASGNFSGIASINLNLHCNEYCAATPRIAVRAMLEGPYNAAARRMNTNLNNAGVLPLTQPYSASPWDYAGAESVPFIPNSNIVDWVLVEVRDGEDSTRIINSQAAFINKNGYIVGLNGSSYLEMELGDNTQNYYVVVIHRNHLSIMTRLPIGREGRVYFEDFTESMNKAFSKIGINNEPMHVNTGVHLMIAGDSDGSSIINSVDLQKGVIGYFLPGYNNFDTNMSLIANSVDLWRAVTNYFERSHVPSATR